MQSELITYLRAGYPGLAITTAEEAQAEAEISAVCTSLRRKLSVWSSTDGLIDMTTNRASPCPDPFEALQLFERMFATPTPQHVILLRDLQLHLDQPDPVMVRRIKDIPFLAKSKGHCLILLGCRHKLPPELDHEVTRTQFFVDLPDKAEREAIWDIVINRHGRKPAPFEPAKLARACEQFTGAEIDAVFVDALYRAFGENREPVHADIAVAMTSTVPLARTMDERIRALRHWANGRAQSASATNTREAQPTRRLDPSRN